MEVNKNLKKSIEEVNSQVMEQSIRSLEVKKKLDDVKAQQMKAEQEKREKAREL